MRYLGGKSRLARRIVDRIIEVSPTEKIFEPFCGGAAITLEVARRGIEVAASDDFPGLCAMFDATCHQGVRIPTDVDFEVVYRQTKRKTDPVSTAIQFGVSFSGKYGGGLARPALIYAGRANRFFDKIEAVRDKITWSDRDYRDVEADLSPGSVVYCDPPYAGTTGYATGAFDHEDFWRRMRQWSRRRGAHVFVSEFNAPDDFACILRIPRLRRVSGVSGHVVDKLFYMSPREA